MNIYVIKLDVEGALVTGVVKAYSRDEAVNKMGNNPISHNGQSWKEWQVRTAYRTFSPAYMKAAGLSFKVLDVKRRESAVQ